MPRAAALHESGFERSRLRDLPPGRVLGFAVMRLFRLLPLALLAALVPATARAADVPSAKTLYADGPSGRYLVDGRWLFRLDAADRGVRQRFYRQSSTAGWSPVTVPSVWNVGDDSEASMRGSVGWYRKDFELPDKRATLAWAVRFESVNYRSRVYLNGREIGRNAGAYIPFTLRLKGLKRSGVNRLVVRVPRPIRLEPYFATTERLRPRFVTFSSARVKSTVAGQVAQGSLGSTRTVLNCAVSSFWR